MVISAPGSLSTPGPPVPLLHHFVLGVHLGRGRGFCLSGCSYQGESCGPAWSLSLVKIGSEGVGVSHPWKRCTFWSGTIDGGTAQSGELEGPSRAPDPTELERGGDWERGEGLNFSKAHRGVWEVRNTASRFQICGLEDRDNR